MLKLDYLIFACLGALCLSSEIQLGCHGQSDWTAINPAGIELTENSTVQLERSCKWALSQPFNVVRPGVRFEAYGVGSDPIISGSVLVPPAAWAPTQAPNGSQLLWQAYVDTQGVDPLEPLLMINSSLAIHARFPNMDSPSPWLRVSTDMSNTSAGYVAWSSVLLQGYAVNFFAGATARLRCSSYYYCSGRVASSSADGTLTLDPSTILPAVASWHSPALTGYFLDGLPAFIDQEGEWVYAHSTNTLLLQLAPDQDPRRGSLAVSLSVVPLAINASSASGSSCDGLSVDGIQYIGFTMGMMNAQGCNDVTISQSSVQYVGRQAIVISGNRSVVTNTTIEDAAGAAVQIGGTAGGSGNGYSHGAVLAYNNFTSIGVRDGYGLMGGGGYTAVTSGRNAWVHHNTIVGTGYTGISMGANGVYENNLLQNICLVLNDGGGIYSWNNAAPFDNLNFTIRNNIILGISGNTDSMVPGSEPAWGRGIYTDDRLSNVVVQGNTVAHSGNIGIFIHGGSNVSVIFNTVFNSSEAAIGLQDEIDEPLVGNAVSGNLMVSFSPGDGSQMCLEETSQLNTSSFHLAVYGPNNSCYGPYSPVVSAWRRIVQFRTGYAGPQSFYDGQSWRAVNGGDPTLVTTPLPLLRLPYTDVQVQGPNLLPSGGMNSSSDMQGWRVVPTTVTTAVFDPSPPALGYLPGGALRMQVSYGQPAAVLMSPMLMQDLAHAPLVMLTATLASIERPWPNPTTTLVNVGVGSASNLTSFGVPLTGLWVSVPRVPSPPVPGQPLPQAYTFTAIVLSPQIQYSDPVLYISVPSFVSSPLWVGNVSVTPVTARAEIEDGQVLERLFTNPTDVPLDISIEGELYQDLMRIGPVLRCSVSVPAWQSVVLVRVGKDGQPCTVPQAVALA